MTEEWPLIDVTLRQFSLPQSDMWEGSKESYVLSMIEEASDETLMALGKHVGFELQSPVRGVEPPFWRKDHLRLFISHLADHRKYAADVQSALMSYGISAFVAHNDIEPTAVWLAEIETALSTCDTLIAFLHPKFHASYWTDQEIGFAMGRGLPVFSIRFGQDPYGFIGRFQAFEGTNKEPQYLGRELFEALRKHKQTQRRMATALVSLFETSGSFAAAKDHIGYLEDVETWDPSFPDRLRAAVETNFQIKRSWGVPESVERLIKRWQEKAK